MKDSIRSQEIEWKIREPTDLSITTSAPYVTILIEFVFYPKRRW